MKDIDMMCGDKPPPFSSARSLNGVACGAFHMVQNPLRTSKLLLIEATAGVGKSTLIAALVEKHCRDLLDKRRRGTLLHLTQAHTYAPLVPDEDTGRLTKPANLQLLDAIYASLHWLVNSVATENTARFFGVIETLHITHRIRPGILSWPDVAAYDRKLAALGCKLAYLKAEPQTIWQRTIESRKNTGFITRYAQKYGHTLEEIFQYFVDEQIRLETYVNTSSLEKMTIAVDKPLEHYSSDVYAFWDE